MCTFERADSVNDSFAENILFDLPFVEERYHKTLEVKRLHLDYT